MTRTSVAARSALPWPLLLAGALLLGYLVFPFLALAGALGTSDRSALLGEGSLEALGTSLAAASVATLVDALLGIPLGLWLARTASPWRHVVTAGVLLPLAVPPVVGGLQLVLWLGPDGWLGALLARAGLNPLNTLAGTVLAQMFVAAPFVVISARAAFASLDPAIVDAARSLGCGPGETLFRALLPAARRGIAAGLVLGWVRCLGEFGATAVVAYHPYTLPTLTYVRLSGEGLATALPAGALLAAMGALVAALLLWLDARRPPRHAGEAAGDPLPAATTPLAWLTARPKESPAPLSVRAAARFGDFHLDVAFESALPALAILGASGAGKSLTLRIIAGLLRPHLGHVILSGHVLLDTVSGVDVPPERRRLGYVAQRDGLFDHLNVESNIGFALRRLPGSQRELRVEELLASMGLQRVRHARPETLSGGERQRVALARALAAGPWALLLDEPFSNVDAAVRRELRTLVRGVHERTGVPLVLVTHDREDTLELADHVVVLDQGWVVQQGPIAEVFARPASRAVAHLVGIRNVLAVRGIEPAGAGMVRVLTDWGELRVEAPDRKAAAWELALPSDAVRIEPSGWEGIIRSVRPTPAAWRLQLQPAPGGEALEAVLPLTHFRHRPVTDRPCAVTLDASRAHLMPATPRPAERRIPGEQRAPVSETQKSLQL